MNKTVKRLNNSVYGKLFVVFLASFIFLCSNAEFYHYHYESTGAPTVLSFNQSTETAKTVHVSDICLICQLIQMHGTFCNFAECFYFFLSVSALFLIHPVLKRIAAVISNLQLRAPPSFL